jgi:anti-sigma regulatory factor (Ser/Thr protein kinase)
MVGEGKLIETGETVKNGRNLGLLYYKCPSCGNSSMSKTVSEYCSEHLQESADLLPLKNETAQPEQDEEEQAVIEALTVSDSTEMATVDQTLSTEPVKEVVQPPKPSVKPQLFKVGACLGLIVVLLFTIKHLLAKPKSTQEEQANG